ncbi:MAG TPA: hypothetical protein VMV75_06740 [Sulfuricella sp.]|nr:hypothetical protein [Sulfuricella sp.]
MPEKTKPQIKSGRATKEKTADITPAPVKEPRTRANAKVAPIVPSDESPKAEKHKKQKIVQDRFAMPQDDYAHIGALKERCLKAGVSVKKSEVLRAALINLSKLSDKALVDAINKLEVIKSGRPGKT